MDRFVENFSWVPAISKPDAGLRQRGQREALQRA